MLKKISLVSALSLGIIGAVAPRAEAALSLSLTSGTDTETGTCSANVCTFNGAVGGWDINVTTGIIPASQNPLMDVSSTDDYTANNINGGTNQITITFTDTSFAGPIPGFTKSIGGTLGTGTGLSYSASATTAIGSTLSFGPGGAFSGSDAGGTASTNPYTLVQTVTLTAAQAGQSSFDANVRTVPEPATMALLGSGLIGLAGLVRRRRKIV